MKKSKLGYKRYSPDVNNPYNIIPSGRITMRDVDFPVFGVDDMGNAQMMYPGGEYQFPGNQVFELPIKQPGGEQLQTPQPFIRPDFFTSQQIERAKQNVLGNLPFGNSGSNPQESTYVLPVRPVEFAAINQNSINQRTVQRSPEKAYQPASIEDRFYEAVTKNTDELSPGLDNLYFMNYNSKNKDSVKAIQKKLADKGYYADNIDGYFGPNTKQAYDKYLSEKVNTDLSGVKFEVPQSVADKRCAAGMCSILEQNDVQTSRLGLKYSNAWDVLENMQSAGNSQTVYNIYDNPKFKEVKTAQELKEATREVKRNSQTKAQDYKVGDIVGLYWPESNEHLSTLNSKTHNTHIGFVSAFDSQGRPIISHNVSGRVLQQPYDQLVTTWISRPNNSGLLTERYKADEYVNTPVSYDKIRNFESKIGRKLGDNEVKTVSNVMRRARYSAQNLAKSLESSVNKNWLESAVFSITGVETAAGLNAPRTIEDTGFVKRAAYVVTDKDPQTVSLGVGKTKLSSLDPFAKSYLDINSEKDLADDNKAVDAITYVLIKNYETFKDYASQYPELGLTEDDVRNMTILSYNQGTSKLLNVGRNPSVPVDQQIANLRRLYNSDNKIYDVSSSNYRFIPGGKQLQQIFEEPAEPYIAKANRYASEVYRKYGGQNDLMFAQGGVEIPNIFKSIPVYQQPGIEKKSLTFEGKINKALGDPKGRAARLAEAVVEPGDDPADNIRHTVAGMYTADAIANKIAPSPYGPTVLPAKVAGFIGSNLAGLAHEVKAFTPSLEGDYRNIPAAARMSAEDMINNFVGSALSLNPFMTEKEKEDLIIKLSFENKLPDGYARMNGRGPENMYFKKQQYGGDLEEFGSGGLKQWFAEKWVDVKTGKECGRSGKDKNGRPYPACRPSRRVNSTTPKTTSEMSSSEKAKFKSVKTSGQRIPYNHKRKQQGGQMSGSLGYDSMYGSPTAAFRYMMNPQDDSKYYGEVFGTKQGPGIAAGLDYDNQKYGTQGMIRLGADPLRGASIRAQGGKRFNPIDNRREELSWGPYGGVNWQTNDYTRFTGAGNDLAINNVRPRLIYGLNAQYNRELANRGRFSIEGDLGVGVGDKYGDMGQFKSEPYGAIKATYSPPMYRNTRNTRNRRPSPTTYSSGYQIGGQMTPQGITPAFFTGMKDAAVDAFKSFMASSDEPMQAVQSAQPAPIDWRKLDRPGQIDYGIQETVQFDAPENRKTVENLLQSTAYMENKYGKDSRAYGRDYTNSFMSIDPIAVKDLFTGRGQNGAYTATQKRYLETMKSMGLPTDQEAFTKLLRQDDPRAAMVAARARYTLSPQALPDMNNPREMFEYWLKNYNGEGVLTHQSREQAYKDFLVGYKMALAND